MNNRRNVKRFIASLTRRNIALLTLIPALKGRAKITATLRVALCPWFLRTRLNVRHLGEQPPLGSTRVVLEMRGHIKHHRLAPRQSVVLPARNQFVIRIAAARKGDERFAHLVGHWLSLWADRSGTRFINVVEN
jgi:hypothetical protein